MHTLTHTHIHTYNRYTLYTLTVWGTHMHIPKNLHYTHSHACIHTYWTGSCTHTALDTHSHTQHLHIHTTDTTNLLSTLKAQCDVLAYTRRKCCTTWQVTRVSTRRLVAPPGTTQDNPTLDGLSCHAAIPIKYMRRNISLTEEKEKGVSRLKHIHTVTHQHIHTHIHAHKQ